VDHDSNRDGFRLGHDWNRDPRKKNRCLSEQLEYHKKRQLNFFRPVIFNSRWICEDWAVVAKMEVSKAMISTAHVANQAAHALKKSSHPALRMLRVEGDERNLIISGRVTSYYLKQLAQETIMSVREGMILVNRVDVVES